MFGCFVDSFSEMRTIGRKKRHATGNGILQRLGIDDDDHTHSPQLHPFPAKKHCSSVYSVYDFFRGKEADAKESI
jgi:hypothetical protein